MLRVLTDCGEGWGSVSVFNIRYIFCVSSLAKILENP